jgi:hypothetical protein
MPQEQIIILSEKMSFATEMNTGTDSHAHAMQSQQETSSRAPPVEFRSYHYCLDKLTWRWACPASQGAMETPGPGEGQPPQLELATGSRGSSDLVGPCRRERGFNRLGPAPSWPAGWPPPYHPLRVKPALSPLLLCAALFGGSPI